MFASFCLLYENDIGDRKNDDLLLDKSYPALIAEKYIWISDAWQVSTFVSKSALLCIRHPWGCACIEIKSWPYETCSRVSRVQIGVALLTLTLRIWFHMCTLNRMKAHYTCDQGNYSFHLGFNPLESLSTHLTVGT